MTVLNPIETLGVVDAILVRPRDTGDLQTSRVDDVGVTFEGFNGDTHSGLTRLSDVRIRKTYAKHTVIRNTRQISILSTEEMAQIAERMGLANILPEWVGANLLLTGIPKLTLLPPSTRLIFSSGASLVVDMENEPCRFPGDIIENHHPGLGKQFVAAAEDRRGLTAWVEKEGRIRTGDTVALHLPPQRTWHP